MTSVVRGRDLLLRALLVWHNAKVMDRLRLRVSSLTRGKRASKVRDHVRRTRYAK